MMGQIECGAQWLSSSLMAIIMVELPDLVNIQKTMEHHHDF
jgi:hypothetical protein